MLSDADVVMIPGSKQTVDDLAWMRRYGLDRAVIEHATTRPVVGICGGMQMLGTSIADPEGVEQAGVVDALKLLPLRTIMRSEKVTRTVAGLLAAETLLGQNITMKCVTGYEIHVGETIYEPQARPFAVLEGAEAQWDGCVSEDGRVIGSYLHGLFDDDELRHTFVRASRTLFGLSDDIALIGWKAKREDSLNRLAAEVSKALDLQTIFGWVGQTYSQATTEVPR
jgi:adenosylcobyric acid synthase